jgi:hypothetical protein
MVQSSNILGQHAICSWFNSGSRYAWCYNNHFGIPHIQPYSLPTMAVYIPCFFLQPHQTTVKSPKCATNHKYLLQQWNIFMWVDILRPWPFCVSFSPLALPFGVYGYTHVVTCSFSPTGSKHFLRRYLATWNNPSSIWTLTDIHLHICFDTCRWNICSCTDHIIHIHHISV